MFKRKDSPFTSVGLGLLVTFIYLKVRNVNLGAYVFVCLFVFPSILPSVHWE